MYKRCVNDKNVEIHTKAFLLLPFCVCYGRRFFVPNKQRASCGKAIKEIENTTSGRLNAFFVEFPFEMICIYTLISCRK